jgi:hypothetical protein
MNPEAKVIDSMIRTALVSGDIKPRNPPLIPFSAAFLVPGFTEITRAELKRFAEMRGEKPLPLFLEGDGSDASIASAAMAGEQATAPTPSEKNPQTAGDAKPAAASVATNLASPASGSAASIAAPALPSSSQPATDAGDYTLSTKEAARLLRLSPRTLETWRREKKGPAYRRQHGRALYSSTAIAAWRNGPAQR